MFAFRFILTIYVGALFFFTGVAQASAVPLDEGIETTSAVDRVVTATETRQGEDWVSTYTSGVTLNRDQITRLTNLLKDLTADFDYNSERFMADPRNFGLSLPFLLKYKVKELEFVLSYLADGGVLKRELDKGIDAGGYNKIKQEIAKSAEERIRLINRELEKVRDTANDSKKRLEALKAQGIDERSEVYVTTRQSIEAAEREIAYQMATIELYRKFSRPGLSTVEKEMRGGFMGIGADKSYEALVADIRRVMSLIEGNTDPMGPKPNLASEMLKRLNHVRTKAGELEGASSSVISRYEAAYIVSWFFSRDNFTQAIEILKKRGDTGTNTTGTTDTNITAANGVALWNNLSRAISQPGGDAFKVKWPEGGNEIYSVADKNIHNVMQFGNAKKAQVIASVNVTASTTRADLLNKIATDYPAYKEKVEEYKAIANRMKSLLEQRAAIVANLNRLLTSVGMKSFEELNPQTDAQVVQLLDQFVEKVASRGDEAQSLANELVKGIKDYAAVNVQIIGLFLHGESILVQMKEDLAKEETTEEQQKKARINRLIKWIQDFDARRASLAETELKAVDDFGIDLKKSYGETINSMLTFLKTDHSGKLSPVSTAVFSAGFSECATLFPQEHGSFNFNADTFSEYNIPVTAELTKPAEKKLVCMASYEWIRKENLKAEKDEFIFDTGDKPFDLKISSIIDSMGDKASQVKDAENFNWSLYEGFHELLYLMGKFQDLVIKVIEKRFKDEGVDLSRANIGVERSEQDSGVAFRLPDSILFDLSHFVLKDDGKSMMKKNIPILLTVLCEFKDIIHDLSIDGHSSPQGGETGFLITGPSGKESGNNQILSLKRAEAVINYCNSEAMNIPKLSDFRAKTGINIVHAGHSYKYPIKNDKGQVDNDASRRVEFKFRLKVEKIAEIRRNPAELQKWRHRINEILAGRPDPFTTDCDFIGGTTDEEIEDPVDGTEEAEEDTLKFVDEMTLLGGFDAKVFFDGYSFGLTQKSIDDLNGDNNIKNMCQFREVVKSVDIIGHTAGGGANKETIYYSRNPDRPYETKESMFFLSEKRADAVADFLKDRMQGITVKTDGKGGAEYDAAANAGKKPEMADYRKVEFKVVVMQGDEARAHLRRLLSANDALREEYTKMSGGGYVRSGCGPINGSDATQPDVVVNDSAVDEDETDDPEVKDDEPEEEEVSDDADSRGGLVLKGIPVKSEHKNGNQGTENICSDYVVQQHDDSDVRYVRLKISKDLWARKLRDAGGDALKVRRDYEPILETLAVNPWRFYPGQHMMAALEIQSRSWQEPFELWNQSQTEVIIAAEFRMRGRDFDQQGPRLSESAAIAEVRKWISYLEVSEWPQFDNEVYKHGKLFNRNIVIIRDGNAQYLRDFYNELKKSDATKAERLWSEHLNPMIEEKDGKYIGRDLSTKRGDEYHNQLKDRLFALYKFLAGSDFPSRSVSPANQIQQWIDYMEKAGWPERGMNLIYMSSGIITVNHTLVATKAQYLNTVYEDLKKTDAAKAERLHNDHLSKVIKTMKPLFGAEVVVGAPVKAKHNGRYHNVLRDHLLGIYRLLAGHDYNLE